MGVRSRARSKKSRHKAASSPRFKSPQEPGPLWDPGRCSCFSESRVNGELEWFRMLAYCVLAYCAAPTKKKAFLSMDSLPRLKFHIGAGLLCELN